MHIRIDEQSAPERLAEIKSGLERVLADVRIAVQDWRAVHAKVAEVLQDLETAPPPLPREEIEETKEFLRWISDDHFTFLGYREYTFSGEGESATLQIREGSGLGVLRDDIYSVFDGLRNFDKLPPEVRQFILEPRLLLITKSNRRSTVHRPVHMDTIGIKCFDENGTRYWRTAPRRVADLRRLQPQPPANPAAAAQGAEHSRPGRLPSRRP